MLNKKKRDLRTTKWIKKKKKKKTQKNKKKKKKKKKKKHCRNSTKILQKS
jgi:hypothetical protein